ncbi:hypothetical protein SAMN05877831_102336 [Rhodobacter maris]|uniref:Uncharacterized protein n=1 Tax=Rhodobacter maris TaxID=446682 RepID=A0A285S178_9RHOB|nr:hypothetical protein SAMN05877831_102336 [Rhodobacter maris]
MPPSLTPPLTPPLGLSSAAAQSVRQRGFASQAGEQSLQRDADNAWPGGWWILPALPLGAAFWIGLLVLLF